jgi:hypothetical protein
MDMCFKVDHPLMPPDPYFKTTVCMDNQHAAVCLLTYHIYNINHIGKCRVCPTAGVNFVYSTIRGQRIKTEDSNESPEDENTEIRLTEEEWV